MQLFYGSVNKQRDTAVDARNVRTNVSFRCTLKPYVYIFVFVNIRVKQTCIKSFSFGLLKLLITMITFNNNVNVRCLLTVLNMVNLWITFLKSGFN